jgi:hypothetical protein
MGARSAALQLVALAVLVVAAAQHEHAGNQGNELRAALNS